MNHKNSIIAPKVNAIVPTGTTDKPFTGGAYIFTVMETQEIWKDVSGYEGYYRVSNIGRVKRIPIRIFDNSAISSRIFKAKIIKPHISSKGYLFVSLSKNGVVNSFSIARLVGKAFLSNPSSLPEINHRDENKKNNEASNLEWCSHLYNIHYGTGIERKTIKQRGSVNLGNSGEKSPFSKLKNNDVILIFYDTRPYKDITQQYGIHASCISEIKNKKAWKHLTNNLK